jgi:hypothetical protein
MVVSSRKLSLLTAAVCVILHVASYAALRANAFIVHFSNEEHWQR